MKQRWIRTHLPTVKLYWAKRSIPSFVLTKSFQSSTFSWSKSTMAIEYRRILLKTMRLYLSVLMLVNRLCMHYKQLCITYFIEAYNEIWNEIILFIAQEGDEFNFFKEHSTLHCIVHIVALGKYFEMTHKCRFVFCCQILSPHTINQISYGITPNLCFKKIEWTHGMKF